MRTITAIFASAVLISCLATPAKKRAPLKETAPPPAAHDAAKIQRENCEGLMSAYFNEAADEIIDDCFNHYKMSICRKTDKECRQDLNGFCRTSLRLLMQQEIYNCIHNKGSWNEYPTHDDPFPTNL